MPDPGLPVPRDDTDRARLAQAWTHGWGAGAAAMTRRDGRPSTRNPYEPKEPTR